MSARVQVILDEKELAAIRERARRERLSLSAWIRAAAKARLDERQSPKLGTAASLQAFFRACDRREKGREPDWDEHLATMSRNLACCQRRGVRQAKSFDRALASAIGRNRS